MAVADLTRAQGARAFEVLCQRGWAVGPPGVDRGAWRKAVKAAARRAAVPVRTGEAEPRRADAEPRPWAIAVERAGELSAASGGIELRSLGYVMVNLAADHEEARGENGLAPGGLLVPGAED